MFCVLTIYLINFDVCFLHIEPTSCMTCDDLTLGNLLPINITMVKNY